MRTGLIAFVATSLVCTICGGSSVSAQTAEPVEPQPGTGTTREQAVEVCKPQGERDYLARLVCADNVHPAFERTGSVGMRHDFPAGLSEDEQMAIVMGNMGFEELEPGATDHHIIDAYSVDCSGTKTTIYLDMYHCNAPVPTQAPAGFTILN